jgi:hypothetical protein
MNQEQARSTNDMSLINAQAQNEAAIKQYEAEMASRHEAEKMALEKYKIDKEAETKLMVAELSAQTTLQTAQVSAAENTDKEQPAPVINIHMPNMKKTIKKNPDGSYSSEESM